MLGGVELLTFLQVGAAWPLPECEITIVASRSTGRTGAAAGAAADKRVVG